MWVLSSISQKLRTLVSIDLTLFLPFRKPNAYGYQLVTVDHRYRVTRYGCMILSTEGPPFVSSSRLTSLVAQVQDTRLDLG